MRKTALTLLFLMLCIWITNLYAQTKPTIKKDYKFGKVLPSEFEIKPNSQDSSASAIKLFDIGNCYFEISSTSGSFVYVYERHVRYKILNKNGYDLANFKIELYKNSNSSKEDLNFMDAATYNFIDGKVAISKLNKDAKFSEEFNKNYIFKKFALPNVKEGSIIEFKYKIKSDFIFTLRGWRFQTDIPTLYSEYNVNIPEYLNYKMDVAGYFAVNHTIHRSEGASYVPGISSNAMHDQYTAENVPALKDEAFITTIDDYIPKISFELQSTSFPNQLHQDYTGTWPKIISSLASDENFGLFINKNSYAKSVLPGILKGEKDTLKVIKLIYGYVKSNLKWDKEYSKYTTAVNPKTIFEKKTGSSADINLSLISLLKEAKIMAYPALVSTRSNGTHPGYPIISKFDNVIAVTSIAGKTYFIDATNNDLQFGMVDYENLSHQVFYMDLKNAAGQWIDMETEFAQERIFSYNLVLDKENKLRGQINEYSKGYAAFERRNRYRKTNNEAEFLKNYKKDKVGLELSNYKIENLDLLDEILTESMNVVIEDNVEEAGDLVYFNPLLYEKTKENIFKHEERKFPVDFAHPIKETYRIVLNFPDDYEVEKLPKSAAYKLPDGNGTFTISYVSEGKVLMVKSTIAINKTLYAPEEYFDLKELFKAVVDKQAEQIVFKKKS